MAILNFGSIYQKSLAHPHVAGNVKLKFKKKLTKIIFLVSGPTKKLKLIRGGYFEFQWNLEKVTCTSPYGGECDSKI